MVHATHWTYSQVLKAEAQYLVRLGNDYFYSITLHVYVKLMTRLLFQVKFHTLLKSTRFLAIFISGKNKYFLPFNSLQSFFWDFFKSMFFVCFPVRVVVTHRPTTTVIWWRHKNGSPYCFSYVKIAGTACASTFAFFLHLHAKGDHYSLAAAHCDFIIRVKVGAKKLLTKNGVWFDVFVKGIAEERFDVTLPNHIPLLSGFRQRHDWISKTEIYYKIRTDLLECGKRNQWCFNETKSILQT